MEQNLGNPYDQLGGALAAIWWQLIRTIRGMISIAAELG